MVHESAFLEAIQEHPDDDLHRLAWADWLDDEGQTDRAAFVRAQLRLASEPEGSARDEAEDEADDLLAAHEAEWASRVGEWALAWQWRRGFIEQVTVLGDTLLSHGSELFAAAPIRAIRLLADGEEMSRLASHPFLSRVEELDVSAEKFGTRYRGPYHRDRDLMALLGSPHWTRLARLEVRQQGMEWRVMQNLIETGLLGRLVHLDLGGNMGVSDRAVQAIAEAGAGKLETLCLLGTHVRTAGLRGLMHSRKVPCLHDIDFDLSVLFPSGFSAEAIDKELRESPVLSRLKALWLPITTGSRTQLERILHAFPPGQLRRLSMTGDPLSADMVEALAGCANLTELRVLQLPMTQLRDGGVQALAESPHFGKLRRLNLGGNEIGGPGIRALVNSEKLSSLRELELWGNYVGVAGCEILASAPEPRRLTFLHLGECHLDDQCARLLGGSPALSRLRALILTNNNLGDEGVKALAASAHLRRLRELRLDHNGIDTPGAEALLRSPYLGRVVRLGLQSAALSQREREQLSERFGPGTEF
jgi:uncharacterized protein (TIGR02996 family)